MNTSNPLKTNLQKLLAIDPDALESEKEKQSYKKAIKSCEKALQKRDENEQYLYSVREERQMLKELKQRLDQI